MAGWLSTRKEQVVDKSLRYRVNVKETSKHEKYWDCTVDGIEYDMDEVLKRSDELVTALEKRYPAPAV